MSDLNETMMPHDELLRAAHCAARVAHDLTAERQQIRDETEQHRKRLRQTVADLREVIAHRRTDLGDILTRHPNLMGDSDA